jgi:hypothetical protein
MKTNLEVGDLVTADGYGNLIFWVALVIYSDPAIGLTPTSSPLYILNGVVDNLFYRHQLHHVAPESPPNCGESVVGVTSSKIVDVS